MLRSTQRNFHKKSTGTCYTELGILHSVGSAGHVVHSSVSGAQNINALFFMLRWSQCGFHKKHVGRRYSKLVFLHLVVSACHVV
jgi:hypothetical protein